MGSSQMSRPGRLRPGHSCPGLAPACRPPACRPPACRPRPKRTYPSRLRPSRRRETGSALIELTWLGLLLIIPLVYAVISIITVQRSAFGATEAVRAAGRAYVLAPDVPTANQRAYDAARLAMRDQGLALDPADLVITCRPMPQSCLQPGSTVQVSLALEVALPLVPTLLGQSAASISVDTSHTEGYGVYREAGQ